uniref:Retinoic acid receptor responder 3-like n=1 Tax=Sinocyclocheilus grahami TaxID=75366 RepID=A0A672MWN3_SINGR
IYPKPGDLIEISRGLYQHWAIYVGEGYVIHLAPPCEYFTLLCDKAKVKKEELYEVVGNDEYCINNLLDEKYEPRPVREMLQDAHRFLGRELPYCVFRENCEHFVTELRYGKPQSRQVHRIFYCKLLLKHQLNIVQLLGACVTQSTFRQTFCDNHRHVTSVSGTCHSSLTRQ